METWTSIKGYEGLYEISNEGRVKSLPRILKIRNNVQTYLKGRIMKLEVTPLGYHRVNLNKKGGRNFLVHRLVAQAFIGDSTMQVNHKDLNKLNNCIDNLEYVSDRENVHHASRIRRAHMPIGVYQRNNRFNTRIYHSGKTFRLGTYDTPEEASAVYNKALDEINSRI